MNNNYQRKFRSQTYRSAAVPEPPRRKSPKPRKRRSLFATILMLVGAVTLFVLLMRYAIVPLLVMLPQWFGGAA